MNTTDQAEQTSAKIVSVITTNTWSEHSAAR